MQHFDDWQLAETDRKYRLALDAAKKLKARLQATGAGSVSGPAGSIAPSAHSQTAAASPPVAPNRSGRKAKPTSLKASGGGSGSGAALAGAGASPMRSRVQLSASGGGVGGSKTKLSGAGAPKGGRSREPKDGAAVDGAVPAIHADVMSAAGWTPEQALSQSTRPIPLSFPGSYHPLPHELPCPIQKLLLLN